MTTLESHELAPLADSSVPNDSHNNDNERKLPYEVQPNLSYDEGSDHENDDEGANVALLGGHSRPESALGTGGVSQPKAASQVIKTIITEVRTCSNATHGSV